MAGGGGIVGTTTVVSPPPGDGAGSSGDTVTEGDGDGVVVEVSSADDVVELVVVESEPESPPQPLTSEPAAIPAARANRAESGISRCEVMSPVVTRRDHS
jgi:hypothetical protein